MLSEPEGLEFLPVDDREKVGRDVDLVVEVQREILRALALHEGLVLREDGEVVVDDRLRRVLESEIAADRQENAAGIDG